MTEKSPLSGSPVWEQRWHPFREEWVLFAAHRGERPWIGEIVGDRDAAPLAAPDNALAPGAARVGGRNPDYVGTYWFTNDLPLLSSRAPDTSSDDPIYRTRPARGTAEVLCYHHDPTRTMADLCEEEILDVVRLWTARTLELAALPTVRHVLIFENKGAQVGTSNPHPHCQIYAGSIVFDNMAREDRASRRYFERTGLDLGQEVLRREAAGPRVVCQNEHFLACVPWFALFAYEVHILPRRQVGWLGNLTEAERLSLSRILREVTVRYDNLWQMQMPYVMAVHQAPTDGEDHSHYPFHLEFHPPLRKPDTLKYLAGCELGGGNLTNESDPDEKAAELRRTSTRLYRER
jgi:UDPglucose--hexose-1-phosphate uridylyltransferase